MTWFHQILTRWRTFQSNNVSGGCAVGRQRAGWARGCSFADNEGESSSFERTFSGGFDDHDDDLVDDSRIRDESLSKHQSSAEDLDIECLSGEAWKSEEKICLSRFADCEWHSQCQCQIRSMLFAYCKWHSQCQRWSAKWWQTSSALFGWLV